MAALHPFFLVKQDILIKNCLSVSYLGKGNKHKMDKHKMKKDVGDICGGQFCCWNAQGNPRGYDCLIVGKHSLINFPTHVRDLVSHLN